MADLIFDASTAAKMESDAIKGQYCLSLDVDFNKLDNGRPTIKALADDTEPVNLTNYINDAYHNRFPGQADHESFQYNDISKIFAQLQGEINTKTHTINNRATSRGSLVYNLEPIELSGGDVVNDFKQRLVIINNVLVALNYDVNYNRFEPEVEDDTYYVGANLEAKPGYRVLITWDTTAYKFPGANRINLLRE